MAALREPEDGGIYALHEPEEAHEALVVPAPTFAEVEEAGAGVILGSDEENLIPAGGDAMLYGDGGAGKTTLAIDLACHLAAGVEWLGIPVPRPVSVLLMENEGPRPLFRRKLRRKLGGWQAATPERLYVWEDPWSGFSFTDEAMRGQLARHIYELEVDVVIAGPVVRLGMVDAGTMPEVRQFAALVDTVRERSLRPVTFLLVHHENKGGRVSGAWEGVGDTLMHVQSGGHGRTRLFVQKARWGAQYHGTTLQLEWAPGDGFTISTGKEDEETRAERVWDGIEKFVLEHPGCSWNAIRQGVSGDEPYKRRRRDAMVEEGVLVDLGTGQRSAYWHRDDPAKPVPLEGMDNRGENEEKGSPVASPVPGSDSLPGPSPAGIDPPGGTPSNNRGAGEPPIRLPGYSSPPGGREIGMEEEEDEW